MSALVLWAFEQFAGLAVAITIAAGVLIVLELVWEASARRGAERRMAAFEARLERLSVCRDCGAVYHEAGPAQEALDLHVDLLLEEGRKAEAVKTVLEVRGHGLKDAMDRVKSRER